MTDTQEAPTTTYSTVGTAPQRTLTRFENGDQVLMLTEIGDGVFVGWDHCETCRGHIANCACIGGPKERPVIARWREERTPEGRAGALKAQYAEQVAEQPEPEPEPEQLIQNVDDALDKATAAVAGRTAIDPTSDVGF